MRTCGCLAVVDLDIFTDDCLIVGNWFLIVSGHTQLVELICLCGLPAGRPASEWLLLIEHHLDGLSAFALDKVVEIDLLMWSELCEYWLLLDTMD